MAKEVRHDKSCRFRLYPNKEQRELIAKTFGCCRWVYNWGLAMRKKAWEEEKKSLSLTDIQSQLPAMKKDAATSWLKEVDAKALIFSLRCMKLPIRTFLSIKAVSLDLRQSMTGINLIKLIRTFFLRKKKAKETWEFPNNKIISFNYLDDPSNFSFYLQFFINNVKSPCTPPIGIKAEDLANMFVFLHNSLDFSDSSNLHPGLVFGTNDDERMPKALYFLRKSTQLDNGAKESFADTLNQSKRIVIFGLSLVDMDYDYFKEFFETDHDSDTEVVIINKEEALNRIRKILKVKGCKRQVSYLDIDKGDEGSIVTDAVKMNKEICYSNFIGLCDTIAEESVAPEHRNIVHVNNIDEVRLRYDIR